MATASALGIMVGAAVGGILFKAGSYPLPTAAAALLYAINSFVIVTRLQAQRLAADSAPDPALRKRVLSLQGLLPNVAILTRPRVAALMAVRAVLGLAVHLFRQGFSLLLIYRLNLSVQTNGLLLSLQGLLTSLVQGLAIRPLLRRFQEPLFFSAACCCSPSPSPSLPLLQAFRSWCSYYPLSPSRLAFSAPLTPPSSPPLLPKPRWGSCWVYQTPSCLRAECSVPLPPASSRPNSATTPLSQSANHVKVPEISSKLPTSRVICCPAHCTVFLGRLASVAQAYAMLRLRRLHDTRGPASTNSLCRSRTICCNRRPDNNASINIPLPGTLRGSASLPCWMPCGSAARLTSQPRHGSGLFSTWRRGR
ncbi:hypothetical protein CLOM_g6518 [Closterium sp. NIES-68]|nr:hypothetical protein CLOM_g6518 [Closterium sp. NIES-68]